MGTLQIKINMNAKVAVRLTGTGEQAYRKYYASNPDLIKISSNGGVELLLWQLMQIFGQALYNGCLVPFQDNVIVIERE